MRFRLLFRLLFAALIFLWGGLFFFQVIQGRSFRLQAEKNRTRLVHLPAARGSILDRRQKELLTPIFQEISNYQL